MDTIFPSTYAIPKSISIAVHTHYFILQLSNGVIVGLCKCGLVITHREILARINTE